MSNEIGLSNLFLGTGIIPRNHLLADAMHERIVNAINLFESNLPGDMEAAGRLVSFGQTVQFSITKIYYQNPDVLMFSGNLDDGSPVTLLQHVSQLSLLLVAVKRNNPEVPRRKIGFCSKDQSVRQDD